MAGNGITIIENFTGYPDGKAKRRFTTRERPDDLPAKYVELLVKKGHAKREPAPKPAKPAAERKED